MVKLCLLVEIYFSRKLFTLTDFKKNFEKIFDSCTNVRYEKALSAKAPLMLRFLYCPLIDRVYLP